MAEELVSGGIADYVSMSRPPIREPDLASRWQAGDTKAADCVSCDACISAGVEGRGVHCVQANA
jgi:2,4-dienoyl-CoA reductase-like NADH-dependent reductase (Old Yellow Enzyme family)